METASRELDDWYLRESDKKKALLAQQNEENERKRQTERSEEKKGWAFGDGNSNFAKPSNIKVKTVTVDDTWHFLPKQIRLMRAQDMQRAWAAEHSPANPDEAHIKVVDKNGNKVGGSRMWGGTFLYVD